MAGDVTVKTRTTRKLATAFARVARLNGRSTAEELRRVMQSHVDSAIDATQERGRP